MQSMPPRLHWTVALEVRPVKGRAELDLRLALRRDAEGAADDVPVAAQQGGDEIGKGGPAGTTISEATSCKSSRTSITQCILCSRD